MSDQPQQLRKDASRYDFLRRFDHFSVVDALLNEDDIGTLDAAVDRAMQPSETEGKK